MQIGKWCALKLNGCLLACRSPHQLKPVCSSPCLCLSEAFDSMLDRRCSKLHRFRMIYAHVWAIASGTTSPKRVAHPDTLSYPLGHQGTSVPSRSSNHQWRREIGNMVWDRFPFTSYHHLPTRDPLECWEGHFTAIRSNFPHAMFLGLRLAKYGSIWERKRSCARVAC